MEPIKINDFAHFKYLSDIKLSGDAKYAAFVVRTPVLEENKYHAHIWLCDTATGGIKRLTSGGEESGFDWLDDRTILFSGNREKKECRPGDPSTTYYTIRVDGGEAEEFLTIPAAVTSIKRIGTTRFALTAVYNHLAPNLEGMSDMEKEEALKQFKEDQDYWVFDELPFWSNGTGYINKQRSRLYLYDSETKKLTPVTSELYQVGQWKLNDAGTEIVYTGELLTSVAGRTSELKLYDIASGRATTLVEIGRMGIGNPSFVGDKILFTGNEMKSFGGNENPHIYTVDRSGNVEEIFSGDFTMGSSIASDSHLGGGQGFKIIDGMPCLLTTERTNTRLVCLKDGELHPISKESGSIECFDLVDGKCCFVGMRGNKLQELYSLDISTGEERQLTSFNTEFFGEKYVATPEPLIFTDSDGVEIDGWVLKPFGYEPGKKYPGILDIHGGPKAAYNSTFFHEMQVWAGEGYFVFFCNPRGGDGRGNEFADIRGKYGTIDYDDLMQFTDKVLEKYPDLDAARLGVTGGSYGGFMTNWIIGHTNRFAAAASQRSIANWITMEFTSDIGHDFASDQMAADTFSNPEKMWFHSPLQYVQNCKTPTLFIHSDEDYRCWQVEGIQMFSALKVLGVDTRLCMFHGENHELSRSGKPKHRIRRLEEITNWMNQYLKK